MRPSESFISQPVRDLQTMLRVLAEDDPHLPSVVPDGYYGPQTMQAVTAFQRQSGLPITGAVDQNTWDTIWDAYETALIRIGPAEPIEIILDPGHVYRQGDSHPYIYLLQSLLLQLSMDHPSITPPEHTGILDDTSAEALAAFQILAGLEPTGELDKVTWKHLVRQYSLNVHHHTTPRDEIPSLTENI